MIQTKQNDRRKLAFRDVISIDSEWFFRLLQMLRSNVVEITSFAYSVLKQFFFSVSVNSGRIFTSISKNNY